MFEYHDNNIDIFHPENNRWRCKAHCQTSVSKTTCGFIIMMFLSRTSFIEEKRSDIKCHKESKHCHESHMMVIHYLLYITYAI